MPVPGWQGAVARTGEIDPSAQRDVARALRFRPPNRQNATHELHRVTSTRARKLETQCRQNDTAIGVPYGSPPNQTDDTRKVQQVCQTRARNEPKASTCAGFVEDCLGVSGHFAAVGVMSDLPTGKQM